jgi:hypothetical protein
MEGTGQEFREFLRLVAWLSLVCAPLLASVALTSFWPYLAYLVLGPVIWLASAPTASP